jgi:hypothetical protein
VVSGVDKERLMAIFIGLIMITSVAGIAFSSAVRNQEPQVQEIPTIVSVKLTDEQLVDVFRSGRVLLEYFYYSNCTDCLDTRTTLEGFANSYDGYVVLNVVAGNESRYDMIGIDGRIIEFQEGTTDKELLSTLCDVAIGVPPECII